MLRKTVVLTAALLLPLGAALSEDVVKVAPATNKVLFENKSVRVVESTIPPGAKVPTHTHPASWYYVTKTGKLKVTYGDGKVEVWQPKVGEKAWMDGEAGHTAENVGKTTLQYVMIEVKCAPTMTPN